MANPSISVPDELLDDFDRVIQMQEMFGDLETDNRSEIVQQLMREYVERNQEYLDQYDAFVEGNSRAAPMTAD